MGKVAVEEEVVVAGTIHFAPLLVMMMMRVSSARASREKPPCKAESADFDPPFHLLRRLLMSQGKEYLHKLV